MSLTQTYLQKSRELIEIVSAQEDNIAKAADLFAETILA
ncbi:MAG: SIS domain-containing protein, partial [Opitutales bacterium]|nr:SIS domain-containing protein [Opitutales bacterium]